MGSIAEDPAIGERQRGELTALFVFKFRSQGQLYLLGKCVDAAVRLLRLEVNGFTAGHTKTSTRI